METNKIKQDFQTSRRRSLFDFENDNVKAAYKFPEEKLNLVYPVEYIDKVRNEIAQWSLKLRETLDEKRQWKEKEKFDSKNKIYDESILQTEQKDFLKSINIDGYLRRVQDFSNKMIILDRVYASLQENEPKLIILDTQRRIEGEVFSKHFR